MLHNGLVDLVFLYRSLYAELPDRLDTFMADVVELLPGGVYDTKTISVYNVGEPASFLEYLFRKR